jgi:hypothetical protein
VSLKRYIFHLTLLQVPALFDLMSRSSGSTVRESVYALSLVAVEGEGRKAILAHSGSIQQLLQQLGSSDSAAVRYAALALGNLAMDADGRRAILQARARKQLGRARGCCSGFVVLPALIDVVAGSSGVKSAYEAAHIRRLRDGALRVLVCGSFRTAHACSRLTALLRV